MALDIAAAVAALAAKYAGLSSADGSDRLRASYSVAQDDLVTPCALTVLASLDGVESAGGTGLTGTAAIDVMVLLDASADVPRRYAAVLRWVQPALTAALTGNTLGQADALAGAVPTGVEVALAGGSDVYAGMPWDMVRVRYEIPFRLQRPVTP